MRTSIAALSLAALIAAPATAFAADYPDDDGPGYDDQRYEESEPAPRVERRVERRVIVEEEPIVEERVVVRPSPVYVAPFYVGRPARYGYYRGWRAGPRWHARHWHGGRRWAHRGRW